MKNEPAWYPLSQEFAHVQALTAGAADLPLGLDQQLLPCTGKVAVQGTSLLTGI